MGFIHKESVNKIAHGHVVIGVAKVKIDLGSFTFVKGILFRCPASDDPVANVAPIWIGGSTVTADSTVATGGMPIAPGESLFIPFDFDSDLYAISTSASQDLAWLGA